MVSEHERHNRAFWDDDADRYQRAHGDALTDAPLAWGAFRAPESELHVLGDVGDLDVLELGCGAAQWSIALTALGARCVGLDLSIAQLRHARRNASASAVTVPFVLASGEAAPFAAASFDVVFSDHGAMSFCDPAVTVAEAARLLRPGGRFAFCTSSPLLYLTYDRARERQTRKLHMEYAELGRMIFADGTIDFVRPPSEWIRLFRTHGFVVDDLLELVAPPGARTTYTDFVPADWARRWPAEQIWKLHKADNAEVSSRHDP